MAKAIQIDDGDNVATVTSEVSKGEQLEVLSPQGSILTSPEALGDVPFGHKIALKSLAQGDEVVKYGEVIGVASADIEVGEWLHTHNVESVRVPTSKLQEAGA
ncbi:UxaA family hydrolase [Candidatus Bathyarchaeota archaeon]|nr:UxaA family hydrolase [Candidatus Bathyarchaeota archaeon]